MKSDADALKLFKINQPVTVVASGKAGVHFCFVFKDSSLNIISHTGVKDGIVLVGQDVYIINHLGK